MDVHRRFGTDKSVPYAKHNVFLIQYPLVICDQGGMHKCIPYESFQQIPIHLMGIVPYFSMALWFSTRVL